MRKYLPVAAVAIVALSTIGGWSASNGFVAAANAQDANATKQDANAASAKAATAATKTHNTEFAKCLPFSDTTDFENAKRGLIAELPDGGVVKNDQGQVVWDPSSYTFIKMDEAAPDSVNPSLWRQAQLLSVNGLFKVTDQIYQIRGYDLSNITFIEGKEGVTVMDPLISKETAKAAVDLYFKHRPKKPIVAVIYTHSHVDHYGGVKGVVSEDDVKAGKVRIIAPEHFTEEAVSENVMAGNAMSRRASYMYGPLLPKAPEGQVSSGLGPTSSSGLTTLIQPTEFVKKSGDKLTIDGLTYEFLMAPGSEAPSEMRFFIPEYKALCTAENACHTLHNMYTLRGAKTRDARGGFDRSQKSAQRPIAPDQTLGTSRTVSRESSASLNYRRPPRLNFAWGQVLKICSSAVSNDSLPPYNTLG